jgi:ankyrin repeat protein
MKKFIYLTSCIFCSVCILICCSCIKEIRSLSPSWYVRLNWQAEEFFDDPKVIELCKAIQVNNLTKVDQLIASGANVNAKGKGNMTPLLWAFPENKLAMLTKLLEAGADPNVQFLSDFHTRGNIRVGSSVLEDAARTSFPGYFKAVMAHGGDPNLISQSEYGDTPLLSVIKGFGPNKRESVQILLDAGADVNMVRRIDAMNGGISPLRQAVTWGGQFDLVILLVEAGADWDIPHPIWYTTTIHALLKEERDFQKYWTPEQSRTYYKLVDLLKEKGANFEEAHQDLDILQSIREKMEGKYPVEDIHKEMNKQVTQKLKKRYENRLQLKQKEK